MVGVTVGDHQCPCTFGDRFAGTESQVLDRLGQALAAAFDVVEAAQHRRAQAGVFSGVVDVHELVEFVVVEDRPAQHDLTARRRRGFEQVLLGPHDARHRGDHLFADGVQGRIGHLGEQFDKVVVQQLRALREHSDRGVGAHRAQRLGPGGRHRGQQDAQIFFAVTEGHLPAHH